MVHHRRWLVGVSLVCDHGYRHTVSIGIRDPRLLGYTRYTTSTVLQFRYAGPLTARTIFLYGYTEVMSRAEAILAAHKAHKAALVEGVLLSSDLTPLVLAHLQLEDGAAAAVCSLWSKGWKAISEGRPRLIYVVGGRYGNARQSTVDLYDPRNASWTQLASMTGPRSSHGCVALEGKLYVVGGSGDGGVGVREALNTAEVYDPQTDGWLPLTNMSTARSEFGLATVGGKIYATGGFDGASAAESVEAYDPQLGSWALVASMSVKRKSHASVVLDGKIYIIGGVGPDGGLLRTMDVYNSRADSWQLVAMLPYMGMGCEGQSPCAVAMGGKIFVTGGYGGDKGFRFAMNSISVYDPRADAWTTGNEQFDDENIGRPPTTGKGQLAIMSKGRGCHASAAINGKLYVFGGSQGLPRNFNYSSAVEVYDPVLDSWVQGPSLTSPRGCMVAVAL